MPDFARERQRPDPCPFRRPPGIRSAHRPLPTRAAAALLPDPRPRAGRRGRGAGDPPLRVASIGVIRRALDAALLAVSDRHEPLSEHAARSRSTPRDNGEGALVLTGAHPLWRAA